MQNSQMEARAEGPGCERTAFTKTAGSLLPLHGPFAYRRWLFDNLTRPRRFTRQGYCATCACGESAAHRRDRARDGGDPRLVRGEFAEFCKPVQHRLAHGEPRGQVGDRG